MARLLPFLLLLAATAAGAQTLDKIQKSGTITLGYRPDSVPFSFVDPQQKPAGFTVDLCARVVAGLASQLKLPGLKMVWVPVTAQDRIQQVTEGKIDLECGTTSVTLGRQKQVDFSLLTFLDGGAFLARAGKGSGPRSPQELRGARVAVSAGTTTEKALRKVVADSGSAAEIVLVANHIDGINQLID